MPKFESQFTGAQIEERLVAVPEMQEDIEYLKEHGGGGGGIGTETDPTVPAWAKQPTKPTYTAKEVGALPADTVIPDEVHIGTDEPSDPNAKLWINPNEQQPALTFTGAVNESWDGTESKTIEIPEGGGVGTDEEIVAILIETDMLPAIYDENGILCNENRNVILRY